MTTQLVSVPDIGGAEGVDVIEVSVAVGDTVDVEQGIVVLETDKASMDIPSTLAGVVTAVKVNVGDKVSEGDVLIEIDAAADGTANENSSDNVEAEENTETADTEKSAEEITVPVPDGAEGAAVIELSVAEGEIVEEGDSLVVLETDKASMDIPAPATGTVVRFDVAVGDTTAEGGSIAVMSVEGGAQSAAAEPEVPAAPEPVKTEPAPEPVSALKPEKTPSADTQTIVTASQSKEVYAGPAVRKFAREMAVELTRVSGTGDRGRVTKADVKGFVKQVMTGQEVVPGTASSSGLSLPAIPEIDFSQFGEIELEPMKKIQKITADNMSRNWLMAPHVTQFDDADITDLEDFRKGLKAEAEKKGLKLTPLVFLLKACAAALVAEPSFNVSLHHDGVHFVRKNYVHIGIAVDTPNGLVVPVIRDVDKKGLWELAEEFMAVVAKAREGKLMPKDMQGGCFTISSLGSMGGQGFTPIVNVPEVAILGVSRAEVKPIWNGQEFVPRNMLPLSLSYDHRAINGADAGRFFTYLNSVIADVRRLLL